MRTRVVVHTANARPESQPAADTSSCEQTFDARFHQDTSAARKALDAFYGSLIASGVRFGGMPLPTSLKPHFIRRTDNDAWTGRLGRFLRLLERTAEDLREDRHFRNLDWFSPEAWELLDIDPGYSRTAVVCRPDIVWEGGSIGLLEMNADSPAMMLYADEVQKLQREHFPLNEMDQSGSLTFEERVPAMLKALVATYREWGGGSERPVIAIVDFPGQKTLSEQEHLARVFSELGCPSFVCGPHELEVRGGRLLGRGEPIDIVQRRMLFPDIVRRRDELGAFLQAYRERLACVINPLRSYVVGCKVTLAILFHPEYRDRMAPEEVDLLKSILPCTMPVSEIDEEELRERSRWVLKPAFGSGGNGVVIGRYVDSTTWAEALRVARAGPWVGQTYLPIPLYRVPIATVSGNALTPLYANWNPFFFGGEAAGGIARVSSNPVVGISVRGALLPSIIANDE